MEQQIIPMAKHHIRESGAVLALRILFAIFIADIFYIVGIIFFGNLAPFTPSTNFSILLFIAITKLIVESLIITAIILVTLSRQYFITDKQLIVRRGIFEKDEKIYELIHIKSVKRHDTLIGKILGYGNLILIFSTSGFHEDVKLANIRHPKRYCAIFMDCMREEKSTRIS